MSVKTDVLQVWSPPRALGLTAGEFIELFKTLPAPELEELQGEYSGFPHLGDSEEHHARVLARMCNRAGRGYWLGKAYGQLSEGRGEGYNVWMLGPELVGRWLRFGTSVGPSQFDDRPSFTMRYADYDNASGTTNLVDEIRRLGEGLYLGIGVRDMPDGSRSGPGPFVLAGPVSEWIGVDDEAAEQPASK